MFSIVWLSVFSLTLLGCTDDSTSDISSYPTAPVAKGELRISVTEGGDLVSGSPLSIRSEVEGRTTIIELIAEGTFAEEGQVVAKLDSATLTQTINRSEGDVERARSALVQAEQAVQIQLKKNEEDLGRAKTELALAERALQGYVEGEYPLALRELKSKLTITEEQHQRAKEEAEASARLFKENFISETEKKADELKLKQTEEEVDIARRRVQQLEDWTKPDKLRELNADIQYKTLALDRVKQQVESELKQKQDTLAERQRSYDLEKEAHEKNVSQLSKTTIRAPKSGLVVYGRERKRYGGDEPMSVGKEVREREEILRIPDMKDMLVEVEIHESSVKKIKPGMSAIVRVDALPNEALQGRVETVAIVPSSESSWLNPDLKVYATKVRLEKVPDGVKPGMHAQVEIIVGVLEDVVQIPLQCVRQTGSKTFVYLRQGDSVALTEIKVGQHNDKMVAVKSGLTVGQQVFMKAPPSAPPIPEAESDDAGIDMSAKEAPQGSGAGLDSESTPGAPETPGAGGPERGAGGQGRPRTMPTFEQMKERVPDLTEERYEEMKKRFASGGGGRGAGGGTRGGGPRGGGQRGGGTGGQRGGGEGSGADAGTGGAPRNGQDRGGNRGAPDKN